MKKYLAVFFIGLITSCQKIDQSLIVDNTNNVSQQELLSDVVSPEDAKKAALEVLNGSSKNVYKDLSASIKIKNSNNRVSTSIKEVLQHKSEDHKSLIYIVKYESGGFCILSGDKRSIPVLAYSEDGTISESDISQNLGLKMWIEQSLSYIKHNSNALSDTLLADNRSQWKGLLEGNSLQINIQSVNDPNYNERIGLRHQRMQEIWDQSNGLSQLMPLSAAENSIPQETLNEFKMIASNNNCPEEFAIVEVVNERIQSIKGPLVQTNWSQGGVFGALVPNSLAGCTAVAAGQIMNYYRYPTQFNWDNMTDEKLGTYTDISLFMQDLGTAFNMSYNSDGSGATNSAVRNGMISYGYNVQKKVITTKMFSIQYHSKNQYT